MENFKTWKTIKQGLYSFEIDSESIGTLEIIYSNLDRKAVFQIGNQTYYLKHTGFWSRDFEITDGNGTIVLTSHVEKWYANTTILEYKNTQYILKIRNNPLAEYVVFERDHEILSYGLTTDNKRAQVKILSNSQQNEYLFDYILWYNFLPIAQENIGDDFTFQSLVLT